MTGYKNSDIAKALNVSPSTVGLWIKQALEGKNNLILMPHKDKHRIAKIQHNDDVMTHLKNVGNKYKPATHFRKIKPKAEFYKIYNDRQIIDIVKNIEAVSEIPHKYTYFGEGVEAWNNYVDRSFEEKLTNTVTNTYELLRLFRPYLYSKLNSTESYNMIDVGTGAGNILKDTIAEMLDKECLYSYVGIDISKAMINKLEENFDKWFSGRLSYSTHIKDINNDSIYELAFLQKSRHHNQRSTRNLILFTETTIENQIEYEQTLLNLRNAVDPEDVLLITYSLDNTGSRSYFDFWVSEADKINKIPQQGKWLMDLLNIEDDFYDVHFIYDASISSRIAGVVLNCDLEINFETSTFSKTLFLEKNSEIKIWRHKHNKLVDIINTAASLGLTADCMLRSKDGAQVMVAYKLK